MAFIYGFLGALALTLILGIGVVIGWKLKSHDEARTQRVTAEELTQTQKQRIRDEQEAWKSLHNYSVEDAYGIPRQQMPGKE